jgi:N-methylhydantoinase A
MKRSLRIGVDIGGTFTDVTVLDASDGSIRLGKALSTPDHLVRGILNAVEVAGADLAAAEFIIHGSTVVINALLERKGARTALLTTAGFRDVYEIGRINRPDSFNLFFRKHVPLVPRERIYGIRERILADGSVRTPLDIESVDEALALALAEDVEAIGVVFLHSYKNVEHEEAVRDRIAALAPHVFVTASHELSREYREFERTSTTAANAFVGPKVSRYLRDLEDSLGERKFEGRLLIMQSSGGLCELETARAQCIQMMESGPAGGVVGAAAFADAFGTRDLICFDMGGTTAKACVLRDGQSSLSSDYFVGGYDEGLVIRVPVIDIKEVGTGGGSIARIDEGGGLHVGPESAGASPGPACYGLGGVLPTVTDANLVLGRLSAERFLGGTMALDRAAAERAIETHVARPLGLDIMAAAEGIVAIANAQMANAVRAVTTQRGLDPRDFTLVAYGGGGPLHAADIARELAIDRVVVPVSPGHFSAFGMLTADLRREYARTHFVRYEPGANAALEAIVEELQRDGRAWIADTGLHPEDVIFERSADVRYAGQEHTVNVRIDCAFTADGAYERIRSAFDDVHRRIYSHAAPDEVAEIVAVRVSVIGRLKKPRWVELPAGSPAEGSALTGCRDVRFANVTLASAVYDRSTLHAGDIVEGPAVVQELASATLVPPGFRLRVAATGALHLEWSDR